MNFCPECGRRWPCPTHEADQAEPVTDVAIERVRALLASPSMFEWESGFGYFINVDDITAALSQQAQPLTATYYSFDLWAAGQGLSIDNDRDPAWHYAKAGWDAALRAQAQPVTDDEIDSECDRLFPPRKAEKHSGEFYVARTAMKTYRERTSR